MNLDGTGLVYADQESAERAAGEYRSLFIDAIDLIEAAAEDIDSLKLSRVVARLKEKMADVNF